MRELIAELVDLGALFPDHYTWATGVQSHDDLARLAFYNDVRNSGVAEARFEILAQELVLFEELRQLATRVVLRAPVLRDAESESDWIDLLSH